ncbi:SRPBCC family protein [Paraconexibacter sp. AEG42_29]
MGTFHAETIIDAPIAEVFAFHRDTRNATRIAHPAQRILGVEGDFPLDVGDEVVLRVLVLPLPIPQRWRVRVAALDEPTLLVDETLDGPFRTFVHQHRFEDLGDGRTRLVDHIEYALPLGVLGRLADALVVARLMGPSFRHRQARTRELLEADARAAYA